MTTHTTTAMTTHNGSPPTASSSQPFEPENLSQAMMLANTLAQSSLIPSALRGKPADVLLILLKGRELGLSALQSIGGLHVIEGKPVVSSETMVALCKRSPECDFFRVAETTTEQAVYETQRHGEPVTRMAFTMQDAKAAELAGKATWKKYPAAMLRARCSAALARAVYPDLVGGIYDNDEGDDIRRGSARGYIRTEPAPDVVTETAPDGTRYNAATGEVVDGPAAPSAPPAVPAPPPAAATDEDVALLRREAATVVNFDGINDLLKRWGNLYSKDHPLRRPAMEICTARGAELRAAAVRP